jgi:hypothetical protein
MPKGYCAVRNFKSQGRLKRKSRKILFAKHNQSGVCPHPKFLRSGGRFPTMGRGTV